MGTPTPTWARVGRRWLDFGRQFTRVVTTTTSRFASVSRTPPGPAAAAVREASRRGYLRPGCALAAPTDSLHHHHHEKSFESLGLSGSILEALNEIGEPPPPSLSLSLLSLTPPLSGRIRPGLAFGNSSQGDRGNLARRAEDGRFGSERDPPRVSNRVRKDTGLPATHSATDQAVGGVRGPLKTKEAEVHRRGSDTGAC